ncbi:MAG: hypothetical protein CM15mP120_09940 [Pseudomonadota bacterium]|nr:MAG: hypothetical protein CM15mP120_09940 [Pseudomonadota bacterium]
MTDASYSPRAFFAVWMTLCPGFYCHPRSTFRFGALNHLGQHLALLDVQRGVLGSKRCLANEGAKAASSICAAGIDLVTVQFNGECSINEIEAKSTRCNLTSPIA